MGLRIIIATLVTVVPLVGAGTVFYLSDRFVETRPEIELQPIELEGPNLKNYDEWLAEQQQKTKELKAEKKTEITMFVAGDVMLSRTVEAKMLEKNDFSYCLKEMRPVIEGADLALANLESPIIAGPAVPVESTTFRAHPKSGESLALAGFDLMGVANNHFGDQGQAGMLETFNILNQNGLDYFGGGENVAGLKNPLIKQVKDIKIAFLGYGYGPSYYEATADKAGLALMDDVRLAKDLAVAKQQADIIVVFIHDGIEYSAKAGQHQTDFAHLAIDLGADLVIGHHPHVVQNMEIYKGKYIYYSLGNFVFDQMWSQETREGLGLMFTLDKKEIKDVDYYPVIIENYCRPRQANKEERAKIIDRL